ncbi:eCIS core domain-containing protein [Streptomyces castrisilvae]|uniref:eCIS core domain-containing protein n=1 Tax=Streptomyces castrisilvae TaxID=3033811 RepID=UPI0035321D62
MRAQDKQDAAPRPVRTEPAAARSADAVGPAVVSGAVGPAGPVGLAGVAGLDGLAGAVGSGGAGSGGRLGALQRSMGNAAVVRALERQWQADCRIPELPHGNGGSAPVQRHEHGPSCGRGEPDPVQRSSVPDVLRGPGRPLGGDVRTEMEARLGADFSDVRLHTGPAAQRSAAEVGARAYTSGSHVVIGSGGADRHTLAHELTHVIQQRQGPVAGTDNGSGLRVSDPSDRFERAAEENARRVLAGPAPTAAAPVQRTADGPARTGGEIAVQRLGEGEAPFDHAQYYAHTNWQASAEQFEQRLGAYAFGHPRALAAARKTVNRLKQLLIKYSRIEHKDSALANKSFFKDDRTSAGQVGEEMTTAQIKDFFSRDGNVRELITAVYNAAYYNKGAELSLKNILNSIIGPKPQLASTLGMNEEELKKHSAFLNSWTRLSLWAGASAVGKGYNYEKDPYALGGLLWQSDPETMAGDTWEMIGSQGPRKERSEADKLANRKTPRDYENRGAPLGARELEFAGKPGPDDKLPWNEGAAYWEIQQNQAWPKANAERGIPIVAGMSGTTTRMLKTFQWINVPGVDVFDYRMALMGWMLPSWDHSLYEILRGSWAAGVKGPGETVARAGKGAALMYQSIAPFTEEELRQHVCVDGQFPHELMYLAQANTPRAVDPAASGFMEPGQATAGEVPRRYADFLAGDTAPTPEIAGWKARNNGASTAALAERLKPAHATALMAYTGGAHQMINSVVRSRLLPEGYAPYGTAGLATTGAEALSLQQIKKQLKWAAQDPKSEPVNTLDEDAVIAPQLAAAQGTDPTAKKAAVAVIDARIDLLAPVLFEEMKAHADMTMEALKRLPPVRHRLPRRLERGRRRVGVPARQAGRAELPAGVRLHHLVRQHQQGRTRGHGLHARPEGLRQGDAPDPAGADAHRQVRP